MPQASPVLIGADRLESFVTAIFRANGVGDEEAGRIAHHLLGANLAGHDSHGVARVPRYVEWLQSGYIVKGQNVETVTDGGTFLLLDGHFGFGQTVAPQAVALGIERARQHGTCIVGLRNAGHIGRVGDYGEQVAAVDRVAGEQQRVAEVDRVAGVAEDALTHDLARVGRTGRVQGRARRADLPDPGGGDPQAGRRDRRAEERRDR